LVSGIRDTFRRIGGRVENGWYTDYFLAWPISTKASTSLRANDQHYDNAIANSLPITEGKSEVWIHPLITGD
jgi:hypothetical protein